LLFVLGVAYLARGTYFMAKTAVDYTQRWVEQRYLLRGKNPLDVFESSIALNTGRPAPSHSRDTTVDADLGEVFGGYPPWAYVTGYLFTWPTNLKWARVYYAALNLGMLAFLLRWGWRCARAHGVEWGIFLGASLAAVSSICTTFGLGQYGV